MNPLDKYTEFDPPPDHRSTRDQLSTKVSELAEQMLRQKATNVKSNTRKSLLEKIAFNLAARKSKIAHNKEKISAIRRIIARLKLKS